MLPLHRGGSSTKSAARSATSTTSSSGRRASSRSPRSSPIDPTPPGCATTRSDAILVSEAAIARGPLDELLRAAAASCDRWARVHWGTPDPGRPAADDLVHGSVLVEGQRIDEWLAAMVTDAAAPLDAARIDAIWRTVVIGIGRPDPLA